MIDFFSQWFPRAQQVVMAAIKYSIGPINPNVSREFFVIVRLAMLIVLAPRSIDL